MKKYFNENFINFFLFPLVLFLLVDLFFKLNNINVYTGISIIDVFISIFYNFKPFLISFIIILGLNAFLIYITNTKISKIIISILLTVLMVVDDYKLVIMSVPIYLSDVSFLNPTGGGMMTSFFASTLGFWTFKVIFKGIVMFGILFIFIYKDKKYKIKYRVIGIILSLLVIILPFKFKNFMVEKIYDEDYDEIISSNNIVDKYYELGFFQGLFYNYYTDGYNKLDYNKIEVASILKKKV